MSPQALVAVHALLLGARPDCARCKVCEKLQPGTWAEFHPDGTCRVERYWDIVEEAAAAQELRLRPP